MHVEVDEIYVSDGAKCDTGNILDIFGPGNRIAVPDPVYPVYVDTNVMAGNTGSSSPDGSYEGLVYLPCTPENNFVPQLPDEHVDLIYLCFPNNPTGAVASRNELLKWVEYARANRAIILYDSAYEAFIQDSSIPRSIFEIPGARDCAIEFRSFSKQGGFTGVRCGYVVIPKELHGYDSEGNKVSISRLWSRRTSTKFNGASYIVQRGAAALFTMEGMAQTAALISHYLGNASLLLNACRQAGMRVWGGENAPYVWGYSVRTVWTAGKCLTRCCMRRMWLLRLVPVLVPGGKGSSAFPRLIHGKTWMKSAAASTACLPDRRAFSDRCPGRGAKHRGLCISFRVG